MSRHPHLMPAIVAGLVLAALHVPSARAQESVSHPFTLQGALGIASCDANGATQPRAINAITFYPRGLAHPTCDLEPPGTALVEDPTCAQRAVEAGSTSALYTSVTGPAHTTTLQRLLFTEPPLEPEPIGPITYHIRYGPASSSGPRVYAQNSTRYLQYDRPYITVPAPADDGDVIDAPFVSENMASLRLTFEFQPTRQDSPGHLELQGNPSLGAAERITHVTINAIGTLGTPVTTRIVHVFQTSLNVADDAQVLDPATVSGFLNKRAFVLGESQIIRAELPINPSSGLWAVQTYTLSATLTFEDNTKVTVTLPSFSAPQACAVIAPAKVPVVKPATRVNGSIVFKPAPGFTTSPYVTAYGPLLWRQSDSGSWNTATSVVTTGSGATIFHATDLSGGQPTTPPQASTPFTFQWDGIPEGTYRVQSKSQSSSSLPFAYPAGHAQLSYPGRAPYMYVTSDLPALGLHRALFAFPTLGTSTASTAATDFSTSGEFSVAADQPVDLTIAADMAYVQGNLNLDGCLANDSVTSGAAELVGVTTNTTDWFGGFARGLFMQGTSDYLVAASAGSWTESRYRLKIDEADYDGMLRVDPAAPLTYALVAGPTPSAGANRTFAVSKVSVLVKTDDSGISEVCAGAAPGCVAKPRLEIGTEAPNGLVEFRDPADPSVVLGSYYSVSNELDADWVRNPVVSIYGLNSSVPTPIKASALTMSNGVPVRDNRNTITLMLGGGGNCCIYVQANLDNTSSTYADNGEGPVVSGLTPSQQVAAGQDSIMLGGTLTDQVPITHVLVNGVSYPVTATLVGGVFTTTFSVAVPLVEGANTFTIAGKSTCDTGAPMTVVITVPPLPPELCPPADTPDICEGTPAAGSAFWIDLVDGDGQPGAILCTVSATPGAAPVCDPATLTTTAQCGN